MKPLNGIEAMRAMGWDLAHWSATCSPYATNSDNQIRRLAGNAFNAYALAPLLACVVATQGLFLDNILSNGEPFVCSVCEGTLVFWEVRGVCQKDIGT